MDTKDIAARVATLNAQEGTQDTTETLFRDVLQAIAHGAANPVELAAAAIAAK